MAINCFIKVIKQKSPEIYFIVVTTCDFLKLGIWLGQHKDRRDRVRVTEYGRKELRA